MTAKLAQRRHRESTRIAGLAIFSCVLLTASGCSQSGAPTVHDELVSAVRDGVVQTDAYRACTIQPSFGNLEAAVDSSAGEMKELYAATSFASEFDKNLDGGAETFIAICIYDIAGVEGLGLTGDHIALWTDEDAKVTSVLALW